MRRGTIRLAWEVTNAGENTLSIDGPRMYGSYPGTAGHDDVPFACGPPSDTDTPSHTYVLTATGVGPGPPDSRERKIAAGLPRIQQFSATAVGTCADPTALLDVSVSWQIHFATGVDLYVDDALYGTFSEKQHEMVLPGQFECSSAPHVYGLTASVGYGPPDSGTAMILEL